MISKLPSVIEIEKLPLSSSFSHHQSNDIGAIFQQMQEVLVFIHFVITSV
jgi:hypothetical protein